MRGAKRIQGNATCTTTFLIVDLILRRLTIRFSHLLPLDPPSGCSQRSRRGQALLLINSNQHLESMVLDSLVTKSQILLQESGIMNTRSLTRTLIAQYNPFRCRSQLVLTL